MQIKSLHLRDWLSYSDSMIEFEPLTVFRGTNGAGKSGIGQALEYLFAGRCSSTDDRGAGAKDIIRKDADRTCLTAEVVDGNLRKIRATLSEKTPRGVVIKKADDPQWNGADYLNYLAINRDALSCLLNGHYFVDMPEARQKELLAGIVLPDSYEWPTDIKEMAGGSDLFVGGYFSINWAAKPFDVISTTYDQAFEARKIVNRQLKEWREPEPVETSVASAEDIRAKLKQRQDERTAVSVERQQVIDKRAVAQKRMQQAETRIAKLNAKLAEERGLRLELQGKILSEGHLKTAKESVANVGEANTLDELMSQIQQQIIAVENDGNRLNKFADEPKCPTCTQLMSREVLDAILGPLAAARSQLKTQYQEIGDRRKALGDPIGAQSQLATHTQGESDLKLVDAKIKEFESDLATEKSQETIPDADTTAQDEKIADLDNRLQKDNEALTKAIQHDARKAEYDKAIAIKKSLDEQLKRLERLVDYFGPKGVQAELLSEHIGGFESKMNRVLEKWGFACQLSFDPYSFTVEFLRTSNAALRPPADGHSYAMSLRTISESQRWRFASAFQIALASATGIRIAVIDAADILDSAGRQMLFGALREAIGGDVDQVIVMMTDERKDAPKVPGVAFYSLSLDKSGDVPTTVVERLS